MGPVLMGQPQGHTDLNPGCLQAPASAWLGWFEEAQDVIKLKKTS